VAEAQRLGLDGAVMSTRSRIIAGAAFAAIAVAVVGVASANRAIEARRVAELDERMHQLSAAILRYTEDSRGEVFPRMAETPGLLFFDAASLYPDYFDDPTLVVAPTRRDARRLYWQVARAAQDGVPIDPTTLERIGAESFYYLDYAAENEIVGMALLRELHAIWSDPDIDPAEALSSGLHVEYPEDYDGPRVAETPVFPHYVWSDAGPGHGGGNRIERLRMGIERFLPAMFSGPSTRIDDLRRYVPVLIERPERIGGPISVMSMGGEVNRVPFGEYPNTRAFLEGLEALREFVPPPGADG
jgi:hypothetical protein